MHIGLIGGIAPAATDFFHRRLISTFARKKTALELTIAHGDAPTLLGNLASNDAASQVVIYMKLTNRLAAAGAECVAITSVAGHFCIDAFKASSVLPVVDLIFEINRALGQRPFIRIGILGTSTVMETRPAARIWKMCTRPMLRWQRPAPLQKLRARSSPRSANNCLRYLASRIMLGGTDLALAFNERDTEFPLIDCAGIHADAIAKLATT
jgi:aspartate racemase